MQSSLLPRPVSPPAQAEARSDTARCEAEARARRAEGRVAALEAKVRALESKVAPAAASAAAARPRELLDPAASSDMVRGLMAELAEQVRVAEQLEHVNRQLAHASSAAGWAGRHGQQRAALALDAAR